MHQKGFGDCFFLAALTATFGKIEDPSTASFKESTVLKNAITSDGNNYTITFYDNQGKPVNVTLDNQIVTAEGNVRIRRIFDPNGNLVSEQKTSDNLLYGAQWQNGSAKPTDASGQPIWASIFERAFAKHRGSYDGINGGDAGAALVLVTGSQLSERFQWEPQSQSATTYQRIGAPTLNENGGFSYYTSQSEQISDPNQIFDSIKTALDSKRYVVAGTIKVPQGKQLLGGVLEDGHAYSVHNAYEANGQKMILVRNPWGKDNDANKKASEDPSSDTQDGFVALTLQEFLENFHHLSVSA